MKLNSTRKGYYEVHVDGKKQSKHTSVTEVIAKGFELKSNNLGAEVRVKQPDLLIDVELSDNTDTTTVTVVQAEVKAFPTAIGAGAYSVGGRGGKICYVDTLTWDTAIVYDASTDSYSGGFYNMFYELDIPAKQIRFLVSGTIVVPSYTILDFSKKTNNANITVSGHDTNIVFETSYFQIRDLSNFILRFCSFYNDQVNAIGADAYK